MSHINTLLIIIFSGVAGLIGASYSLSQHEPTGNVVVLDVRSMSEDLLDKAKKTNMTDEELAIERHVLARDVKTLVKKLEGKGLIVLDSKFVFTAPSESYVNRESKYD